MQNVSYLTNWYKKNLRELPWRTTTDPYRIWISEVILQQTQVSQGLDYYFRFVSEFPDIQALAASDENRVLKLWQGLGYYSRARNMHKTAKLIVERYNGIFPVDKKSLMELPGIGDYTSSAILSFAFNLPFPTLDGNVFRVVSRLYDIDNPIDIASSRKVFLSVLDQLIEGHDPRMFNNAFMELGAMVCKPDRPSCDICPLNTDCQARKLGKIDSLPKKSKLLTKKKRFFNYLFINYQDKFLLSRRSDKDIWANLYDFPLIETPGPIAKNQLQLIVNEKFPMFNTLSLSKQLSLKHVLTHQVLDLQFWSLDMDTIPQNAPENCLIVDMETYTNYPVPVPVSKFLLSL